MLAIFSGAAYAQTGPGGVGNSASNGLWLRADAISAADSSAVSSWADLSGNGNNALQNSAAIQPLFFNTSSLNNMPVVRFDGTNDEMAVPDNDILDGTPGITFYAVLRPTNLNGAARGIVGKRVTFTVSVEYAYSWFFYTGNRLFCDVHMQDNRFNAPTVFTNATNYMLSFNFNGALPAAQRSKMYSSGTQIMQATETSAALPNSNQSLALAALNVGYGTYLGGDFAEIIQFNYSLDTLDRILVENYLSSKYNIALAMNDLYDEDDAGNGNYDFDVAGIGRINASILRSDAQGSGIVRMRNPAGLNDNEFLFWGHDNGGPEGTELVDVPAGVEARYDRVWRASEVNGSNVAIDVGAVDISWDLAGGPVTASDLRLLVDTDNDGTFADETPLSGAASVGGNVYEFSGVTAIANNLRFTLGTINSTQTPLPVSLVSFSAKLLDNYQVRLNWQTASEINNDYFTVEKSTDASQWEEVLHINGAGNSTNLLTYSATDDHPFSGTSYYRLKQTDFDGQFSYSQIRAVNKNEKEELVRIYPNPARNELWVEGPQSEITTVRIYNMQGQEVSALVKIDEVTSSRLHIDLGRLPEGVYALRTITTVHKLYKR